MDISVDSSGSKRGNTYVVDVISLKKMVLNGKEEKTATA
jgi:hypothetical protein